MKIEGKIGIVAGRGDLPRLLIQECQRQELDFFVLALENQTDKETVESVPHAWNRIGALGKSIEILQSQSVKNIVMAGGVTRPSWLELRPDFKAAQILAKIGAKAFGDDGILTSLIQALEKEGFCVLGAHDLLSNVLASKGLLGRVAPREQDIEDMNRAFEIAKALGAVDVGQAAIVQQGIALAVEAVEGTDTMLQRCLIARDRVAGLGEGGVLVKVAKPNQERRVDLPSIGPETIMQVAAVKLNGIALEANKCLIIKKDEVVERANELGIFLYGMGEAHDKKSK